MLKIYMLLLAATISVVSWNHYFNPPEPITIEKIVYIEKEHPHLKLMKEMLPGYTEKTPIYSIPVTLSSYNPTVEQCDADPFINSANMLVAPGQVAIPKLFRLKLGLKLKQFIVVSGYGIFQVVDHMNKRYEEQAKIDIISFIPDWSKEFGIKHDVLIYWW